MPKKTATQIGLDAVLSSSIIILLMALFIPPARIEIMSVVPLIVGLLTAITAGTCRWVSSWSIVQKFLA